METGAMETGVLSFGSPSPALSRPLFGTDGIRGRFGVPPLCPLSLECLAEALGRFLHPNLQASPRPVLIGRDTRFSGPAIQEILKKGLERWGIPVSLVGVLPTPALCFWVQKCQAPLGIMISASHNPAPDNGLKFFGPFGEKLSGAEEERIQQLYVENVTASQKERPSSLPSSIVSPPLPPLVEGDMETQVPVFQAYLTFLRQTLSAHVSFRGVRLVLDCAHGAAYQLGPEIFKSLGAEVQVIGAHPDGSNINAGCGALFLGPLQQAVLDQQADWGIGFDGDGDRVLWVDARGQIVDGDQLLAFLALLWERKGLLPKRQVVSTVMANHAFQTFLEKRDIRLLRTCVGDRHVFHHMCQEDLPLGGEPSGHLILRDFLPSGDGLLAALQVMAGLMEEKNLGRSLFPLFRPFPHILTHVPLPSSPLLDTVPVQDFLSQAQERVSQKGGRVLVRPSGTEPLLRILVEGEDKTFVQQECDRIVSFFEAAMG